MPDMYDVPPCPACGSTEPDCEPGCEAVTLSFHNFPPIKTAGPAIEAVESTSRPDGQARS